MSKVEKYFIGSIALLCAFYLFFTFRMRIGSFTDPGPGFVPALLGISGLVASLLIFILGFKSSAENSNGMSKDGFLRFLGYLISTIAFIPLFKYLGTIVALFFLVFSLTKISGSKGWVFPVVLAAICAGTAYMLFYVALAVPLPTGIF